MLMNDVTSPGDVRASDQLESQSSNSCRTRCRYPCRRHDGKRVKTCLLTHSPNKWPDQRIPAGHDPIEKGEFHLFCQLITPLTVHSGEAEHYEILVPG